VAVDAPELLGDEADPALNHEAKAFHAGWRLPRPDFLGRASGDSGRSSAVPRTLVALCIHVGRKSVERPITIA
jgi:hypothetical protein